MNDTPPPPDQRQCSIAEVFEASFIELLKLVPANPYVRALVLKFSGKLPPAGCDSFDALKDWVECHCVKRIRKPAASRPAAEDGIRINVDFSETEYGRANYSVPRSGREGFRIGADELLEIIRDSIEAGAGIQEVVEVIAGRIDDDAWNQCEPAMDDCGDYDYNEHDATDTSDSDVDYSKDEIRSAVLQFVRENHPELAVQL